MYQIGNDKVWCGDFHGQWHEPSENLPLDLAAYSICGFDFTMFNSGDTSPEGPFNTLVQKLGIPFLIPPYCHELFYDWGHLMVCGMEAGYQPPAMDNPNYENVLRQLRPHCKFISLAHPYEFFIPNIGRLLDAGLLDSFAFNSVKETKLKAMYDERLTAGKRTPIVAELDFHVTAGRRDGYVSYNTVAEANSDLGPVAKRVTLVFCDRLETDAIYEAVRQGRSCVDVDNTLIGPADLIEKLEKGGYREQKAAGIRKRESLVVTCAKGDTPVEGEPFTLTVTDGSSTRQMTIPALNNAAKGNSFFHPVVIGDQCRAVKITAAQEARILPGIHEGKNTVTVRISNNSMTRSASGKFTLSLDDGTILLSRAYSGIIPCGQMDFPCAITAEQANACPPRVANLKLEPDDSSAREIKRDLICVTIPYSESLSESDWQKAYAIRIDQEKLLDPLWTSHWEGVYDCSGEIRMLWNSNALFLRAAITDSVLAPSLKKEFIFMGDSLQFGFIPFDRPDVDIFSFYHFLSTRGGQPDGDECCRMDNVPKGTIKGHRAVPFRLPAECHKLERIDATHSILTLTIPWNLMPLLMPRKGTRFLTHFILWDNDGNGIKDSLSWPNPSIWYLPSDWMWASAELV